jgi:hypothetical protein
LEFQVNSYTTLWQSRPSIATDPEGNFVVAWQSAGSLEGDTSFDSVQARRFPAQGAPPESEQIQLNSYTTGDQIRPAVTTDAEGNFVVAWESYGSSGSDDDGYSIQARRFATDGSSSDLSEFQVNTYTYSWQQRAAVASDPQGSFVVAWDSWGSAAGDTQGYSVQARRFRADGEPLDSLEFQVNTFTTSSQFYAAVATCARGDFVIAWYSGGSPTGNWGSIRARRYRADGTALDPSEFRVDTLSSGFLFRPAIAADPGGNFVVVWENLFYPDSNYRIFARRFAADGTPLDPAEFQVNTYSTSRRENATVAMGAEGNFVVAWESYGSTGNDNSLRSVQARRYRADGTAVDPAEFQVNAYTSNDQRRPRVAMDPEGNFVVAWQSTGSFGDDTSYTSVQARRFGRPTIPVTSTSGGTGGPGCTLRDALTAANTGAATGGCPAGNEGGVVELPADAAIALAEADNAANALPLVERPITVRGRGARIERDSGLACPAGPEFRLFEVADGGILTLESVSVSNGCLTSAPGAGVLSSGGTVVLRKASIEGNETGSNGGGMAVFGGALLAFDSTVRGNLAAGEGGGVSISGDPAWLLLQRSTLSENIAASGGGVASSATCPALVRQSTISGNSATSGGGLDLASATGGMVLDFSTVAANAALDGAGARVLAGELALHGSLVGDNSQGADCAAAGGSVEATGANLDTDGSCAALAGGGVATVASLGLGPLADQGGHSRSHLPVAGSPAIDAAPACAGRAGAPLTVDQRGYPRPTDDDGDLVPECEIGAVERGPVFLDGFDSGEPDRWSTAAP